MGNDDLMNMPTVVNEGEPAVPAVPALIESSEQSAVANIAAKAEDVGKEAAKDGVFVHATPQLMSDIKELILEELRSVGYAPNPADVMPAVRRIKHVIEGVGVKAQAIPLQAQYVVDPPDAPPALTSGDASGSSDSATVSE